MVDFNELNVQNKNSTEFVKTLGFQEKEIEDKHFYSNPELEKYFNSIMEKLLKDDFTLENYYYNPSNPKVHWVISEDPQVNAYFQSRPFYFCIYRKLIDLIDNEDQLAFIMGHEIGHFKETISKNRNQRIGNIEELKSDTTALDRMAKAGYNISEAMKIYDKIAPYNSDYAKNLSAAVEVHSPLVRREALAAAINVIANKWQEGAYGNTDNNGNVIKNDQGAVTVKAFDVERTPLNEIIKKTEYVSPEEKFASFSTREKTQFILKKIKDFAFSKDSFYENYKKDEKFSVYRRAYLEEIKSDMHSLHKEEDKGKKHLQDGTAPVMIFLEEYFKMFSDLSDENEISELLQDKNIHLLLSNIIKLSGDVRGEIAEGISAEKCSYSTVLSEKIQFSESSEFWKGLKKQAEDCMNRLQKRMGKELTDQEQKEADKDWNFLRVLCFPFSFLDKKMGIHAFYSDFPKWPVMNVGDEYPEKWAHFFGLSESINVPDELIKKAIGHHHYVYDLEGHYFAIGEESKTDENEPTKERVLQKWENERALLQWLSETDNDERIIKLKQEIEEEKRQKEIAKKEKLRKAAEKEYEKVLQQIRDFKKKVDDYVDESNVNPDPQTAMDILPIILPWSDTFSDNKDRDGLYFSKMNLEYVSNPSILDAYTEHNYNVEKYILNKSTEEEKEFLTHTSKDLVEKIIDKYIESLKVHSEDKTAEPILFPYLVTESKMGDRIPNLRNKIIENYIANAPKTKENIINNSSRNDTPAFVNMYKNSLAFYYAEHRKIFDGLTNRKEEKNIDFSNFKTPIPQYILDCFHLPNELSNKTANVWNEFIKEYADIEYDEDYGMNRSFEIYEANEERHRIKNNVRMAVFDILSRNNGEPLPLSLLADLGMFEKANTIFNIRDGGDKEIDRPDIVNIIDMQERKIIKKVMPELLKNEENWPESLVDFAALTLKIPRNYYLDKKEEYGWGAIFDRIPVSEKQSIYSTMENGLIKRLEKENELWIKETDQGKKKAYLEDMKKSWQYIARFYDRANSMKYYEENIRDKYLLTLPIWTQADTKDKVDFFVSTYECDWMWGGDIKYKDDILNNLLTEIGEKELQEREELLFTFMKDKNRISNPELREKAQNMWVDTVFKIMGEKTDDESDGYLRRIKRYTNKIKTDELDTYFYHIQPPSEDNKVAEYDKASILRKLAEKVVSQKELSQRLKPDLTDLENKKISNILYAMGAVGVAMQRYPEKRNDIIKFLRSKGTKEDCNAFRNAIDNRFKRGEKLLTIEEYQLSLPNIKQAYDNFHSAPKEFQLLMIDHVLVNAPVSWEENFNYVAEMIFPGETEQAKMIRDVLKKYISSREEVQKNFALAEMLVASGTEADSTAKEDENQRIGKGVRVFLESIGPAGIKIGQALSSAPNIPTYIRDNLKDFKSNAARPARWDIYDWFDKYKKDFPNEADSIDKMKLGKILGSASFFITMDAGEKDVVKCLRLGAFAKAKDEMGYILKTLNEIKKQRDTEGKDNALVNTLLRVINQANDSTDVETDMHKGYQQFKDAKEIYPQTVTVDNITFNVKEAEWTEYGNTWARLEKMSGVGVDKIEDSAYKKSASIAYFSLELLNIFAGGKFDFDRHAGQMNIDKTTNTLGLFDTGSMLLENPTPEDQMALGRILYKSAEHALISLGKNKTSNKAFSEVFANAFTNEIERFYAQQEKQGKQPTDYLVEVQRGLLALSDFYKDFTPSDFMKCFDIAFNNPNVPVSQHIMSSFTTEMLNGLGVFKKKDAKEDSLQPAEEKEKFGRLLFNLYAASTVDADKNTIGEVLKNEYDDQDLFNSYEKPVDSSNETDEKENIQQKPKFFALKGLLSVLGNKNKKEENTTAEITPTTPSVLASKEEHSLSEKAGNPSDTKESFENIKIPTCFGKHIFAALKDSDMHIDPIIVKGAWKEIVETLQDKNNRDEPQVKEKLGEILCDLFVTIKNAENLPEEIANQTAIQKDKGSQDVILLKKGMSKDYIINETQERLKKLPTSKVARNIRAVISLSEKFQSGQQIDLKEAFLDILSQKNLDKNILKGMQSSLKKNGYTMTSFVLPVALPTIRTARSVYSLLSKKEGYLESKGREVSEQVTNLSQNLTAKQVLRSLAKLPTGIVLAPKNAAIVHRKKDTVKG